MAPGCYGSPAPSSRHHGGAAYNPLLSYIVPPYPSTSTAFRILRTQTSLSSTSIISKRLGPPEHAAHRKADRMNDAPCPGPPLLGKRP